MRRLLFPLALVMSAIAFATAPRRVDAQQMPSPTLRPVSLHAELVPSPHLLPPFPSTCDRGLGVTMVQGAAVGLLTVGIVLIAATPILVVANIGGGKTISATPFLVGGAVIGTVMAVIDYRRNCG